MDRASGTSDQLPTSPRAPVVRYSLLALAGLGSSLLGVYLATLSGSLFGGFACAGGIACEPIYQGLLFKLWVGVSLLALGLGAVAFSVLHMVRPKSQYSLVALVGSGSSTLVLGVAYLSQLLPNQNELTNNCFGSGCDAIAQTLNFYFSTGIGFLVLGVAVIIVSVLYMIKRRDH